MALTAPQLALFTIGNYRFSTIDANRPSSLYFQDANGNQGRWRRGHAHGETLIYQGRSRRLFIAPDEMENYSSGLEDDPRSLGNRFGSRANGDYQVLARGIAVRNISLDPVAGWHVLELCPPDYYARHGSAGEVSLDDDTVHAAIFAAVPTIADTVDWTA